MSKKAGLFLAFAVFSLALDPSGSWTSRAYAFESLLQGGEKYGFDILKDRQVAGVARSLLGRDYKRFTQILDVSSPIKVIGGRYVFGQGCESHNCVETGALIVVDTRERKVWAAMTDGDEKKSWPGPIAQWPAPIRAIVKSSYE